MKILFYGAGVMGSLYAAKMKKAGHDVYVLARGKRVNQLRNIGIVLRNALTNETSNTHVKIIDTLHPEDHFDIIFVMMPKNKVDEAIPALSANKKSPIVLFMLNNAAGFSKFTEAVGKDRVLFGFPGAGGVKKGNVVVYRKIFENQQATVIGEIEGEITPRLEVIGDLLRGAGFKTEYSDNIDAWLMTHAVEITPVANALYLTGCDIKRLSNTRDALILMIRAIKEGYKTLLELRVPIQPKRHKWVLYIPEVFLLCIARKILKSKEIEELIGHANNARGEMKQLTEEIRVLARKSGNETTALDLLYALIYPNFRLIPEGSSRIRIWKKVFKFS